MSVTGSFIVPHPPIIIPEVGRGEENKIQKTIDAYNKIAERISELKPDTIVLTSPHSIMYADYFHISPGVSASGDLRSFRAPEVKIKADYDTEFVSVLSAFAGKAGIPAGTLGERNASLDHGTLIPLYFINKKYKNYKLVRIGLSGLPFEEHYRLGMCISKAAEELGRNVVFVASGDLSHKLTEDGPYGYCADGVEFDREITQAMSEGDFMSMLSISLEFSESAAECGLRSFIIMAGALDGVEVKPELLSYEGPFGVGYGIASFIPAGKSESREFLDKFLEIESDRMKKIKENEDEYVKLARYSVESYVKTHKLVDIPENLSKDMTENNAGVFVSLKKNGDLRGCIGTIYPVTGCIADEILRNAVSACSEDPRFGSVEPEELPSLVYSVDVLSKPEQIESAEMLDIKKYGVIVTSGRKRGLLLPDLEGINSADEQIRIACRKAGIREGEKISLERFEAVRHT